MQKLTVEQRDWLISQFNKYHESYCTEINSACEIKYDQLMRIINQCTEQEFPEYLSSAVKLRQDKQFNAPVMLTTMAMHHHFELEEFKQFTAGCVAIVKYLEDNNV